MTVSIWWARRDLRLADNQALTLALQESGQLLPVFIIDERLVNSPYVGEKRLAFLWAGLRRLDADLQARGSRLIVRRGDPIKELSKLYWESGARAIYAEADVSPYARQRDGRAAAHLPLKLIPSLSVHPPESVLKENGDPYMVYTPYSRRWREQPWPAAPLPAPSKIFTPDAASSLPIPESPALPAGVPFLPGEIEAQRRLRQFTGGPTTNGQAPVYQYNQNRHRVDVAGTAGLSPYLRFGMISARQAAWAARQAVAVAPDNEARKNAESWLNELIWRDFFIAILYHFPQARRASLRPEYRQIRWRNDEAAFDAWRHGQTGYPIVDAAMRQLCQTGWMPNRARMITASFLTKDLLINWQRGERWFMQQLVDGDPAANNGGWQWTAGTGVDAAPYFRIFNPILQGVKHDPQGTYIRRWLPELAGVPDKYIHQPWKMPAAVQAESGCRIGRQYPAPIVDHDQARRRTLDAYAEAKDAA